MHAGVNAGGDEDINAQKGPGSLVGLDTSQKQTEEDTVVVVSHLSIAEGMDTLVGKEVNKNKVSASMMAKQWLFNSRALKEVTNKLEPKPIKLKPVWAGPKGVSKFSSREVGPINKWDPRKSNNGLGEAGMWDNNELNASGGPLPSRPPDPTQSLKSEDALIRT